MLGWGKDKKTAPAATPAAANTTAVRPRPLTESSIDAAPAAGQSLSHVLLSAGQITPEQLHAALEKQKATGRFIGEILIEDKVIEEQTLISFLAKHCKIPHLSLLDYLIDKEIVKLIPKEICLRYRLLPIDKLGKNLTVAMVNPLDTEALQHVRDSCPDLRIKPILCAYKHFELVTEKVFREEGGGGAQMMSASSFGIRLTPQEKETRDALRREQEAQAQEAQEQREAEVQVTPPATEPIATPKPDPVAEPDPEFSPPPDESPAVEGAPVPSPATEPAPPPPSAPSTTEVAPAGTDSMFDSIFASPAEDAEDAEAPAPAPALTPAAPPAEDGGMSALMQEMASVMMDSMRDTYSVLARRMDLFRGIDGEAVAKIFAKGITEEYEAGDIIFQKGDPGDRLYLILGGSVEIFDGPRVMATLERGALFGEMALISREPRSAGARAAESSSLLALSHDTFHNVMPAEVSIQLLVNIIVTMSKRLRSANEMA